MLGNQPGAEGLPLSRQVRGASGYEDILAGNDFLSVFLESTLHRLKKETTTTSRWDEDTSTPFFRETREATDYYSEVPQTTERQLFNSSSDSVNSSSTSEDSVIIAVHVSSSVGSQVNKLSESSGEVLDQNYITAEERPSLVANSGKSELSVEEPAPVTKENVEEDLGLKANVQSLPSSQHISFNPREFPNSQNKDNVPPPFHHSLIYHDTPSQPGRARSVSYSTIIQDIQPSKTASDSLERKERNYATGYGNSFDSLRRTTTSTTTTSTTITTSTTTPPTSNRNWQAPKIYGRSEQNYEIDEAVSVVTNGRTHGIQQQAAGTPKPTNKTEDGDQKVGYVVEGRNYRKYRVEERTPDGFIVGEYGVVSHDDGSLRGVRYTADGTINPRLIYDALMKFLAL